MTARPASEPALEADDVAAGYTVGRRRSETVVHNVNAALHPGEFVCLLGPNGAGKSTLLRTLVGSQDALGGTVRLGGRIMSSITARERARHLSVVLTDRIDVGYLTVRELVAIGRTPRVGWLSRMGEDDRDVVERSLEAAGASDLTERQVTQLSDGERQRVMIARALAQEPEVLVLDEPTAFLDLTRRVELLALLRELTESHGLAVLMSTHELELALRHADSLWLVHPDGHFSAGVPEDLAYAGEIAGAYAADGVEFDEDRGTFVPSTDSSSIGASMRVMLTGEARARHWVRQAVERTGWQVVDEGPALAQIVLDGDGRVVQWQTTTDRGGDRGSSCAALIDHLRQLDPDPDSAVPAGVNDPDGATPSPMRGKQ